MVIVESRRRRSSRTAATPSKPPLRAVDRDASRTQRARNLARGGAERDTPPLNRGFAVEVTSLDREYPDLRRGVGRGRRVCITQAPGHRPALSLLTQRRRALNCSIVQTRDRGAGGMRRSNQRALGQRGTRRVPTPGPVGPSLAATSTHAPEGYTVAVSSYCPSHGCR